MGAYAYDLKKQRLVEDYQNFYSYDNNGNLVTKSRKGMNGTSVNYIYSSDNQLVEVQFFENYLAVKNVFYRYDALGRRTQRTVVHASNPSVPVSRVWVYDGSEMIAEHDGELNHLATYTQSTMRTDDTLSVRVTSAGVSAGLAQYSGTYNYLKDALGSVTAVTDNTGNLVQRYVYSSFGKILSIKDETATDVTTNAPLNTAYAFTNREWDEDIGLYYYRARYYDQSIGRFLSEDPDAGSMGSPGTVNSKYVYVTNNPLSYIDPSGAIRISINVTIRKRLKDNSNLVIRRILLAVSPLLYAGYDRGSKRTQNVIDSVVVAAVITTAIVYTGGAAGAAVGGGAAGALAGGIAGGVVGGAGYEFFGVGNFEEGFIVGFLAGAVAGYNASAGSGRSPAGESDNTISFNIKETLSKRAIPCVGSSLLIAGGAGTVWFSSSIAPVTIGAITLGTGGVALIGAAAAVGGAYVFKTSCLAAP